MTTEQVCLMCKHIFLLPGHEDYSEITPGEPMEFGCAKQHWRTDASSLESMIEFRAYMEQASDCADFEPVKV